MGNERIKSEETDQPEIKRVIIENQDGTVRYIDEKYVKEWLSIMTDLVHLDLHVGGDCQQKLNKLKWKCAENINNLIAQKP